MKRKSMIKKMALVWLLAVLPSLACMAEIREGYGTFEPGIYYRFDTETHNGTVIQCTEDFLRNSSITIPSYDYVDGIEVCIREIGEYAFNDCYFTSVTLPSTLKTIQKEAFSNNTNLKTVVFNDGLQTIGEKAFYSTAIIHVEIPQSVTSIGDYAFALPRYHSEAANPTLDLGTGVKTIGNHAFEGCFYLRVVIPDQVEWIGDDAFRNCALVSVVGNFEGPVQYESRHTIDFTLGKGLTHVGSGAFADNRVVNVTVNNGFLATNIPSDAFSTPGEVINMADPILHIPEIYYALYEYQEPWSLWFYEFEMIDTAYPLWVGGSQVKTSNRTKLAGGKVSFDPFTNTLTLNNTGVYYSNDGISNGRPDEPDQDGYEGIDGLTIKVVGDCSFTTNQSRTLVLGNNTTITGTGTLTLKGKEAAIYLGSNDNLTISGGVKVIASGKTKVIYGEEQSGALVVNNSTLEAIPLEENTFAIEGIDNIVLNNCEYRDPGGAWRYTDTSKFFYQRTDKWIGWGDEGYYRGKEIIIKPTSDPVDYRLFLNGTRVNSSNCNNIPVEGKTSGTAKWDNATKTLTLTNLNATSDLKVSGISSGNINRNMQAMPELNIELEGDNKFTITSEEGKGLYVNRGNVTIKGNGKLELKSSGEEGIFVEANSSLNLHNTEVVAYGKHCAIKGISSSNMVVNHSKLFASSDDDEEVTIQGLSGFDLVNAKYETLNMGLSEFHNDWCIFYGQYFNYDANNSVLCYNGIYTNDDYGYDEDLSCDWKHSVSIVPTEISISTNISEPVTQATTDQPMYNVAGQRVGKDYKGIVIINGKKTVIH